MRSKSRGFWTRLRRGEPLRLKRGVFREPVFDESLDGLRVGHPLDQPDLRRHWNHAVGRMHASPALAAALSEARILFMSVKTCSMRSSLRRSSPPLTRKKCSFSSSPSSPMRLGFRRDCIVSASGETDAIRGWSAGRGFRVGHQYMPGISSLSSRRRTPLQLSPPLALLLRPSKVASHSEYLLIDSLPPLMPPAALLVSSRDDSRLHFLEPRFVLDLQNFDSSRPNFCSAFPFHLLAKSRL